MSISLIIFLIILGILLFLVEFLVLPGVTIAGIGGAISLVAAVVLSFAYHGTTTGIIVLFATTALIILTAVLMLKSGTWKRVMLTREIDSKVDLVHKEEGKIAEGDTGTSVTRLNPVGRVLVNGEFYEARSQDRLIDQNVNIVVVKVESNRLIVKPVN
ncbi:MAG: NfeD family protein [Bacteroidales bacterium]